MVIMAVRSGWGGGVSEGGNGAPWKGIVPNASETNRVQCITILKPHLRYRRITAGQQISWPSKFRESKRCGGGCPWGDSESHPSCGLHKGIKPKVVAPYVYSWMTQNILSPSSPTNSRPKKTIKAAEIMAKSKFKYNKDDPGRNCCCQFCRCWCCWCYCCHCCCCSCCCYCCCYWCCWFSLIFIWFGSELLSCTFFFLVFVYVIVYVFMCSLCASWCSCYRLSLVICCSFFCFTYRLHYGVGLSFSHSTDLFFFSFWSVIAHPPVFVRRSKLTHGKFKRWKYPDIVIQTKSW